MNSGPQRRQRPSAANGNTSVLAKPMARLTPALSVLTFFSVFINLSRLIIPLYLLQIIDRVTASESEDTLIFITIIAVAGLLVAGLLMAISKMIQSRMAIWLEQQIDAPLADASLMGSTTGQSFGASWLRDLSQLRNFISGPTLSTFFEVLWTPIFVGIIFYLHTWLGIFAASVCVVLLLMAILNDILIGDKPQQMNVNQMKASRSFEHAIENSDTLLSMGMAKKFLAKLRTQAHKALGLQASVDERRATMTSVIRFVRSCAQIGILGLGAYLILQGEITTGTMIAASILQSLGLSPIDQAVNAVRSVKMAAASYQRIRQQLTIYNPINETLSLDPGAKLDIALRRAMFIPQGTNAPVLRPIQADIKGGEMVGILGPAASGKTTLCRLLVGAQKPSNGTVLANNLDLGRLIGGEFGNLVGYMPQSQPEFKAPIIDIISRYTLEDDPKRFEAAAEAAKLVGIHETILGLTARYETVLDEQGMARLSRSQYQRILLARAFFGSPKLLVLDEPTTFLDKAGEAAFVSALEKMHDLGTTIFVVSQRQHLMKSCDKLMLLREGMLADFGEPSKVLSNLSSTANRMHPRLVGG